MISVGVKALSFSYIGICRGYTGSTRTIVAGWMIVEISAIISVISVSIVVVSSSCTGAIAVVIMATHSRGADVSVGVGAILRIIISAIGISAGVSSLGEDIVMDSLFLLCAICGFGLFFFADIVSLLCVSMVSDVVMVANIS
jgi:hypothetical protein